MNILVLCTANICRSPMAEALLAHHADQQGRKLHVTSAGFRYHGAKADPLAIEAMAERGLQIDGHRSRILQPEHLEAVDLIVTMSRTHVRDAALVDRTSFARALCLKELLRVDQARLDRDPESAGGLGFLAWREALVEGRSPRSYLMDLERDKVTDPIGGSIADFRATADELDGLTRDLLTRLP